MTLKVIRGIAAAMLLLAGASAQAGLGPNGLGPNGLGPNGLGPNGLGPNGLGPNGLGPNGLGPNGLGPNGLGPNGLGPNGLGPNGLGPNGLDVNGLGPNGLGPNGLGPNGLVYLITPAGVELEYDASGVAVGVARDASGGLVPVPTFFGAWFDRDPAAAAQYMKYFARCAYDAATGIAWIDSTGKTWAWTGQYGFAMASLRSAALEPLGQCTIPSGTPPGEVSPTCSQQVRARMTAEEGGWVSSCLLAHVNLKGTHQYISIRGNPPGPEAQAAVATSVNESIFMPKRFGILFADLFSGSSYKAACRNGSFEDWATDKVDLVLGRDCDVRQCYYTDPAGATVPLLDAYFSGCNNPWNVTGPNPPLKFLPSLDSPELSGVEVRDAGRLLHPLMTYGPGYLPAVPNANPIYGADGRTIVGWKAGGFGFQDVALCAKDPSQAGRWQASCSPADSFFTSAFDPQQTIECGPNSCLGGNPHGTGGGASNPGARTFAMVDLSSGQASDWIAGSGQVRYSPAPAVAANLSEPVTALIRYSKDRTASAHIFVSNPEGDWVNIARWTGHRDRDDDDDGEHGEGRKWGDRGMHGGSGAADIWPATGAGQWDYLQIYPVYIRHDPYRAAAPGRHCATNADCAPGLGLQCRYAVCDAEPIPATGAAGQPTWTCGGSPGQLKLYAQYFGPTRPMCIEQCTSDAQCAPGDVCSSGRCVSPVAKVRIAGAAMSESCTGPQLFRGASERGDCSKVFAKGPKKHTVCPKKHEVGAPCLGSLVYGEREGVWGWYCRGGGEALFACQAEDSPDLDAVGFVPTRPWCMAPEATTFVGICK